MKIFNYLIYLILLLIFMSGCSTTTPIAFPRNNLNILYYSKYNYSYEKVLINLKDLEALEDKEIDREVIERVPPKFPRELLTENNLKKNFEEVVVLKAHIDKKGLFEAIVIERSGGDYLDHSSIDALRQWKFKPSSDGDSYMIIPFTFKTGAPE
jgi:TonB family protein